MSQALRGEDVTVFGDGTQTRSFCYVTDLVDGILRLMESNENDPVNIGNPHEMTIEEIARTIIRMTGSKSQIVYRPLPEDDPKVRQPDITRARTLLGWEPKVGARRGAHEDARVLPWKSVGPGKKGLGIGRGSALHAPRPNPQALIPQPVYRRAVRRACLSAGALLRSCLMPRSIRSASSRSACSDRSVVCASCTLSVSRVKFSIT